MSSTAKRWNYHGVRCKEGSWVSEIRVPGVREKKSRIWLGTFLTAEMAAIAHDVAARILQGEGAIINFPANLQHYPMPGSLSLADIPAAAVSISKLMSANSVEGRRQLVVAGLHGGGESNGSGGAGGGGGGGVVGGGGVGDGGIALPFGPEVYIDEEAGLHGGGESNGGGGAVGGGGGAVGGGGVGDGGIALPFGPEVYIDEEAIFNMHLLLTDMADGLLMNRWHMPYSDD